MARTKTPARLLAALVWGSGALSALITNDAVCVLRAPLVVRLIQRHRLPPLPFLLALATAANTGSVATLVGNPQNMLCGTLGHLSYREHLLLMAPVALIGLAINHALLHWTFRDSLATATLANSAERSVLPRAAVVSLGVIGLTAVAYTWGSDLAWTAAAGFAALFVVVEGLMRTGVPAELFARYPLDQGVENLSAYLRLSTIFLVGSVANIIVAEAGREVGGIGFRDHLKVGLPLAALTTLVGTLWVTWLAG